MCVVPHCLVVLSFVLVIPVEFYCSRADKVRPLTIEKWLEMLSKWICESPTNTFILLFQFQYIPLATEMHITWDYQKASLSLLFSHQTGWLLGICCRVSTWSWEILAFVIVENLIFRVLMHICVLNSKMQKTGSIF